MATHTVAEIEDLPTLCVGQCCSLKIDGDEDGLRVWLCRVSGEVEYERNFEEGWRNCDAHGKRL